MSPALKTDLRTEILQVSPAMAKKFLNLAGPNRFTQPIRVKLFEEIIHDGYWRLTHQGIAFTIDGKLCDGIHRLTAIANGKITVPILATWNLPPEAVDAIDLGMGRSPADIINIREKTPERVSKSFVAVARQMVEGFSGSPSKRMPMPVLIRLIVHHFDAIHFTHEHAASLACHFKAPVARAWYTKDRDRLAEFLKVARLGVSSDDRDTAAALLMLRWASQTDKTLSATARSLWYRRTESALQAFLRGKGLSQLCEVKHELYPIPDLPEE